MFPNGEKNTRWFLLALLSFRWKDNVDLLFFFLIIACDSNWTDMRNNIKDRTSQGKHKTKELFGLDNHLYIQTVFVYNKCQRMSTVDTDKTINGVSRFVCMRVSFLRTNRFLQTFFLFQSKKTRFQWDRWMDICSSSFSCSLERKTRSQWPEWKKKTSGKISLIEYIESF